TEGAPERIILCRVMRASISRPLPRETTPPRWQYGSYDRRLRPWSARDPRRLARLAGRAGPPRHRGTVAARVRRRSPGRFRSDDGGVRRLARRTTRTPTAGGWS